MKGIKKTIMLMAILLAALCTPLSALASTESPSTTSTTKKKASSKTGDLSTDNFTIKVSCGLQGNYKYGLAIPVNIDINSLKSDFEGTLRIIVPGNSYYGSDAYAYEKDVLLAEGSEKTVSMSVYNNSSATNLQFQLIDASGKVIIDESIKLASKAGESALVGVLSEDYTAVNYFDKGRISLDSYEGTAQLIELDEDTFPQNESGIECLSYIIINSFDTSKLSQEQLSAIEGWVANGGVLIIGGGSDIKTTVSGLSNMIKLKDSQPSEGTLSTLIYGYDEDRSVAYTKEDGIYELSIDGAAIDQEVLTDSNLVSLLEYEKGHIMATGFNLGMEPIQSWNDKNLMAEAIYKSAAKGYSQTRVSSINYGTYQDYWSIQSVLTGVMQGTLPRTTVIIIILIIFVLVAPIMYFILKKIDKRELLWILLPVSAVLCTIILFIANWDIRIRYPILSSITNIYEEQGADGVKKSATASMGVLVPTTRHTEVQMNNTLSNLKQYSNNDAIYDSSYGTGQANWTTGFTNSVKETADGYLLGFDNKTTFVTNYVGFECNDIDQSSGMTCEYKRTIGGISGKVTNNTGYNLKGVCVFTYGKMVSIGQIKNGESAEFKESDNKINYDWDFYSMTFPGIDKDSEEHSRIASMLSMIYQSNISTEIDTDRASVFTVGVIDDWTADYAADKKVKEFNKAIYTVKTEVGYEDYADAYMNSLFKYAEQNSDWDMNDGQLYATSVEAVFDVGKQFDSVYALIRAKDNERSYGNTKGTKIYALNWSTYEYDQLFEDDVCVRFDKNCPYLSEDGYMQLKFTTNNIYDYVPYLTIVGGAK